MFDNKLKAIEMCVARFDSETKSTFLDLYTKVDDEVINPETEESELSSEVKDDYDTPDNSEDIF
jgi:hypothetical protein